MVDRAIVTARMRYGETDETGVSVLAKKEVITRRGVGTDSKARER